MLDQTHPAVSRPALLVVVPNQTANQNSSVKSLISLWHQKDLLLIIRIGISTKITLNEISRLVGSESEEHMNPINVTGVKSNRVASFGRGISELKEVVWHLRRSCHLTCSLKTKDEDIENETVVLSAGKSVRAGLGGEEEGTNLENETGELKSSNHTVGVDVGHILVGKNDVVLAGTVISLNAPIR